MNIDESVNMLTTKKSYCSIEPAGHCLFPVKSTKRLPWGKLGSWRYDGFLKWGVPLNHHPFRTMGFSLPKTIHLLGTPHDYGNPHILFLVVRKGKSWWTNWIGYPKLESRKTIDLLIFFRKAMKVGPVLVYDWTPGSSGSHFFIGKSLH